jgi:hypothetical protein
MYRIRPIVRQTMTKGILTVAAAVALAAAFGCATMSAPGGTAAAPDELAAAVTDGLMRAYEQRDVPGFMALVSARYLGGYGDLQAALEDELATAVSVDLEIRPERVWEQQDNTVFMDAGWDKTVVRSAAPDEKTTAGRVTFVFIRYADDVLKLLSQKGDPVFP